MERSNKIVVFEYKILLLTSVQQEHHYFFFQKTCSKLVTSIDTHKCLPSPQVKSRPWITASPQNSLLYMTNEALTTPLCPLLLIETSMFE